MVFGEDLDPIGFSAVLICFAITREIFFSFDLIFLALIGVFTFLFFPFLVI